MPSPVLRVPVDDAAFQRYIAAFKKYQDALAEQPEVWQGINRGIQGSVIAGAALAQTLGEQAAETHRLAEEERKREDAADRAEKRRAREERDSAKREEQAARRRKEAISQVKDYGKTIVDIGLKVGKYALGGGLLTGVLGGFGLGALAGWAGDERRTASGLGVGIGQRQGIALNMQRYFDVDSTIQRMGEMQANPADWSYFAMLGINPKGKNPGELAMLAAQATRNKYRETGGNLTTMSALGYTRGMGLEDIRRVGTEDEGSWRSQVSQSRRVSGLEERVAKSWQNFSQRLAEAGLKLKSVLLDKLTTLEQPLEKFVQKITDLAVKILDRIDFDRVGRGLEKFADKMASPEFEDSIRKFVDSAGKLANGIVWIVEQLPSTATAGNAVTGAVAGGTAGFVFGGPLGAGIGAAGGAVGGGYYERMKKAAKGGFDWFMEPFNRPVDGPVTSRPGTRRDPFTGKQRTHNGTDYAVPVGTPVHATQDGRVSFAGQQGGYGNIVRLEGDGQGSGYAHLSRIAVMLGQEVRKGQVIGYSGSTGRSTGPHLHYEETMRGGMAMRQPPAPYRGYRNNTKITVSDHTGSSISISSNAAVTG